MKKLLLIIFTILILVLIYILYPTRTSVVEPKSEDTYRIMTYNIKYAEEWLSDFLGRKEMIVEQILDYQPDVFGVQEANYGWMNENDGLISYLDDYSYVGVGRDDGYSAGEYSAIFYLTDRFELIASDTFWFSTTPDVPSLGWDSAYNRICTYATLKDVETNEIFTVYNLHLDHKGEVAKKESTNLLIDSLSDDVYPYIVIGDFNYTEFSSNYKSLVNNGLDNSKNIAVNKEIYGTINYSKNYNFKHFVAIDFILMQENKFNVLNYQVDNNYRYLGLPVSDHFPVIVDFKLQF